MTFFSIFNRDF